MRICETLLPWPFTIVTKLILFVVRLNDLDFKQSHSLDLSVYQVYITCLTSSKVRRVETLKVHALSVF